MAQFPDDLIRAFGTVEIADFLRSGTPGQKADFLPEGVWEGHGVLPD